MTTKNFVIAGTHCNACKVLIEEVSKEIPGVISCTVVNYKTGETILDYDEKFDWNVFKKEIESLGKYDVGN